MKKVVIIGPESTGKSTLSQQLAEHYETSWCPEYAREYLTTNNKQYNYDDLLNIAKGQIELESRLQETARNHLFIIDTDMYVMKVWCEVAFQDCHKWILKQIAERSYDLYLLCNVDLPWVADELREYPELKTRKRIYKMYKDIVVNTGKPWVEISGNYKDRFESAVDTIESIKSIDSVTE